MQHITVQYSTLQYSTGRSTFTVQYSTVQNCTVQWTVRPTLCYYVRIGSKSKPQFDVHHPHVLVVRLEYENVPSSYDPKLTSTQENLAFGDDAGACSGLPLPSNTKGWRLQSSVIANIEKLDSL